MNNVFSISNIAWNRHDDPKVLKLLREYGISGIEIAPGKVWGTELSAVTRESAKEYRKILADEGFSVPGFQAILFGHPEFQVFEKSSHEAFLTHLKKTAELAAGLDAKVLVFGAPKNRKRNGLSFPEAMKQAAEFFNRAGRIVQEYGCVLGIEANPVEYQCDFLTNTADAKMLVEAAATPGVGLHFDTGATVMTHENTAETLAAAGKIVHYHISEPMLANIAEGSADHVSAFRMLKKLNYAGAVSIEMKAAEPELENLQRALSFTRGKMNEAEF